MENEEQEKKEHLESSKESNWVDEWNAGTITGIVISLIFVLIMVIYLVSLVYNAKQTYRPISSLDKFVAIQNIVSLMGTAACLFIRSFRRGLSFWRGLLTIIGAYLMFTVLGISAFRCFTFGLPALISPQAYGPHLFLIIVGALILTYGFKSKKAKNTSG